MDLHRTLPAATFALALVPGLPGAALPLRAAVLPCQITIDFGASAPLDWNAEAHRAFRREATDAWAREGVVFCWHDAPCPFAPTLYVRVVGEVPAGRGEGRATLGWIGFSERTGPGPLILLSHTWAQALVGRVERGARALRELPGMVARLLPRALGRALAHELGHYLLARREHASTGLMRASFRPEDLADDVTGKRMALTAADRRDLRARCAHATPTTVLVTRNP
jgi:hypothetical protein